MTILGRERVKSILDLASERPRASTPNEMVRQLCRTALHYMGGDGSQESGDVAWNGKYSVGQPVVLVKDGALALTVTKSKAILLGGVSPVVFLEGLSGPYLLENVLPIGEFFCTQNEKKGGEL